MSTWIILVSSSFKVYLLSDGIIKYFVARSRVPSVVLACLLFGCCCSCYCCLTPTDLGNIKLNLKFIVREISDKRVHASTFHYCCLCCVCCCCDCSFAELFICTYSSTKLACYIPKVLMPILTTAHSALIRQIITIYCDLLQESFLKITTILAKCCFPLHPVKVNVDFSKSKTMVNKQINYDAILSQVFAYLITHMARQI